MKSTTRYEHIKARVQYRALYECFLCGHTAPGWTAIIEVSAKHPFEIKDHLESLELEPKNMPVGWASFGKDVYRCPACSGKKSP